MTSSNPIPQVTQWLLSKAADRLELELRERLLEEWAADVDDASSWHAKLRVAGSIYLARNAVAAKPQQLRAKKAVNALSGFEAMAKTAQEVGGRWQDLITERLTLSVMVREVVSFIRRNW
jgi:hypothetical protein